MTFNGIVFSILGLCLLPHLSSAEDCVISILVHNEKQYYVIEI